MHRENNFPQTRSSVYTESGNPVRAVLSHILWKWLQLAGAEQAAATARGSPKPREHTFKNQSPSGKAWVHSIPVSAQIVPSCSRSSFGAAPGAEHSGDTGCVFWDQGNGAQAHPHCSLKSPGKNNPPSAPAANHRHAAEAHPWASPTAREKAPSQRLQAGHTPFTSDSCCHYEPGRINQHSSAKQHKH